MNDDVVSDEHVLSTRSQSADVNDLCRLCANIGESMVPIYADEGADHGLEIKIKTHLPFLNIQIDDSLPKRICYHCASALLVWNEVFELSTVADLKLRNWFETSPYDQRENKTVPYDVMGELNTGTVEFEDISDVNMFHKNDNKPVNTLNDLQTVSSSPKRIKLNHFQTMLNHELKSPVIQNDEKYSDFKGSMSALMFNRPADDDMEEDVDDDLLVDEHNMYLDEDDDMNRLMDCHRLDMSTTSPDYGGDVGHKREYADDCAMVGDSNDSSLAIKHSDGEDGDDEGVDDPANDGRRNDFKFDDEEGGSDEPATAVRVKTENEESTELVTDEEEEEEEEDDGSPVSEEGLREAYANGNHGETLRETMCEICATAFKTRYNLLRHFKKRHPEFKMYECDLCRISYASIDEFKDHLEQQHSRVHTAQVIDSKQVRFACDVCGNMYKNKASAMNHLLTHTAKKTVQCPHCDFECYTKQQLGVHQTKHDKRFVCDICHKRFAQKSQLDVHINAVHYNQRPFKCVLCHKTFKTKGSHDAHMIVHTDTRNYQCPHCDKKCRKRYDLTLHIRTHTGEKPFKCSVCGRGFVQMCDTRKHEMLHFRRSKRKTANSAELYCAMQVGDVQGAIDDEDDE